MDLVDVVAIVGVVLAAVALATQRDLTAAAVLVVGLAVLLLTL